MEFREFDVGDVVTIVSEPYIDCPFNWVEPMTNMCGDTVTIVKKEYSEQYKTYKYKIQEDGEDFIWCGNCFLPLCDQDVRSFHIGDRVYACVANPDDNCMINIGDYGTVCDIGNNGRRIAVKWDDYVNGHDCDGKCDYGYGWWVDSTCIELDEFSDVEIKEESFLDMIGGSE